MITVGIATVPARQKTLMITLASIKDQADKIIVALNDYTEVPQELYNLHNTECIILDNSFGDSAKFLKVSEVGGYYFSLDDDLWYPPSYCQDTIRAIDKYGCICTYHGKIFAKRPIQSYHRGYTTAVRCTGSLVVDTLVDIGGSGCMGFNTKDFKLSINDFKMPLMADIWASKTAHEQGVKIMALAHNSGYFHYLGTPDKTIWKMRRGNQYETNLVRSFLK